MIELIVIWVAGVLVIGGGLFLIFGDIYTAWVNHKREINLSKERLKYYHKYK